MPGQRDAATCPAFHPRTFSDSTLPAHATPGHPPSIHCSRLSAATPRDTSHAVDRLFTGGPVGAARRTVREIHAEANARRCFMSISERKEYTLRLKSGCLSLGRRTLVMGILNVTPDSFSDAGKFFSFDSAVEQASELISAGADILDIGGESTRPFSDPVPLESELERVLPVIEAVRIVGNVPISIDTTKAEVAKRAIEAGADIINDVSAMRFDENMVKVASDSGVPVILMHMQGNPKNMQQEPRYASLLSEIVAFLEDRIQFAVQNGVDRSQIIVDPGIGFGKTVEHNLSLIRSLSAFGCLDRPVLLGASRKRFIGSILGRSPEDREVGTAAVNAVAIAAGVHILRVHDVGFHLQVARVGDAIRSAG